MPHYTILYHIIYLLGFDPHDSFTFGYEWALQYELLSRVKIEDQNAESHVLSLL